MPENDMLKFHKNRFRVPRAANRLEAALLPHQRLVFLPTGIPFQMSRSEGENAFSRFTGETWDGLDGYDNHLIYGSIQTLIQLTGCPTSLQHGLPHSVNPSAVLSGQQASPSFYESSYLSLSKLEETWNSLQCPMSKTWAGKQCKNKLTYLNHQYNAYMCTYTCIIYIYIYVCVCASVSVYVSVCVWVYLYPICRCVYMCMCVCVCDCVCVSVYLCIYISMYLCICVCMHACMHVCMYACTHVRMYACTHVCMWACVHVCMCACVHVCMYGMRIVCYFLNITNIYGSKLHSFMSFIFSCCNTTMSSALAVPLSCIMPRQNSEIVISPSSPARMSKRGPQSRTVILRWFILGTSNGISNVHTHMHI